MNIEDELFCLRFELETLSNKVNFSKSERWVKGFIGESTENAHLDRYNFVAEFAQGKNVLDIACGSGYGTKLLSEIGKANFVTGVDIDEEAVKYGSLRYPSPIVERFVADATSWKGDRKFDLIVSFETIEHIPNYGKFLDNLAENMHEDSDLYISTPIAQITTENPENPYHVIEWNFKDFHNLLSKNFLIQEIFVQNLVFKPEKIIKPTLVRRIGRKLFNIPIPTNDNVYVAGIKNYESLSSLKMDNCYKGYQIVHLKKK